MSRHTYVLADRFFSTLGLVFASAAAVGAVFLFALAWATNPTDHLAALFGASVYVILICWPGIPAFFLGRLMWRRSRSRSQ